MTLNPEVTDRKEMIQIQELPNRDKAEFYKLFQMLFYILKGLDDKNSPLNVNLTLT
jgi:hypothetical protein